jgi:L-fuculose-phosphate aldolase
VVDGDEVPPTELFIHTQIYRARPDVRAVVHAHSRMAVVMSVAGLSIVPVTNNALILGGDPIPVYPDPRLVRKPEQGDALARALGADQACIMRHHGTAVVGSSLMEAFLCAYALEENALRQHLAMQVGTPIPTPTKSWPTWLARPWASVNGASCGITSSPAPAALALPRL